MTNSNDPMGGFIVGFLTFLMYVAVAFFLILFVVSGGNPAP